MNRKELKNKNVVELMLLLLDNNISIKDKKVIDRRMYYKLSKEGRNIENWRKLYDYFSELKKTTNIDKYLYDTNISTSIKKYVINHGYKDEELQDLLKKNIPYDLKQYIIKNKISQYYKAVEIIKDDCISDDLKDYCIKKNININNIINILIDDEIDEKSRAYILSTKEKLFIRALRSTSNKELINMLTFDFYQNGNCLNNVDFIKKYKPSLLNNLSNCITSKYIKKAFDGRYKNEELVNKVLEGNEEKINKILNSINNKMVIAFLEANKLPEKYIKIIINNNIDYLNEYIDKLNIDIIKEKLSNYGYFHNAFKELIINRRLNDLVNKLKKYSLKEYFKYIDKYYYNDNLIINTIDNKIPDEEIINILNKYYYANDIINLILKYKSNYFKNIIDNINWDNLINNREENDEYLDIIYSLPENIQSKVFKRNSIYIREVLKKYDRNTLKEFLNYKQNTNKFIMNIQNTILKIFNVSSEKINYCKSIIKYCNKGNVLELLNNIEYFFNKINIDINTFFQYGSHEFDNNIIGKIIDIVSNNEINNFLRIKDYFFNNYFDNTLNNATLVMNLNTIIKNYTLYKELLLDICNKNIILSDIDKTNLSLLFEGRINGGPLTIYDLDILKRNNYGRYKEEILKENTNINRIKDIFFNNIISFDNMLFDNIGNISSLKILQKDNSSNKEIFYLTEEIITSMDMINKLLTTNNREELVRIVISYIDGEDTLINKMINNIINIKSKIKKLYELDSRYNLTTLESAREINGIYNEEYMKIYGGEVFDFRDKNYVLYAHVMSRRETIDEMIAGYSNGNSNFISLSPISYRGQKYYYDNCDCILAYDTIPNNSFICSSLTNMGSNYMINKNSAQVSDANRDQRGILETSSVKKNNAETLLYRDGLRPCGIVLVNGKKPTEEELKYHKMYNLPFIITQKKETAIENPKRVFTPSEGKYIEENKLKELDNIKNYISSKLIIKKENDIYTGREVAIFTDTHAMYEPTIAILEDIRYKGINEIYSLGDNTSLGPSPREVLDLMGKYNVKQIMGNSEYYLTLGGSPFSYWNEEREKSLDWTNDKVHRYINNLKLYKPSIDISLGDKKIALCHFGNDIRWDFINHNTWIYQENFGKDSASEQFLFTNSDEYNKEIEYMINKYGINNPIVRGYLSSKKDPMFNGNIITNYDEIFQGHVHFELEDKLNNTNIHTLRGAGMGELENNKKSMAYYIILKEKKKGGFDIEKVYVPFNKNSLLSSIYSSDMPTKSKILSYLR